MVYRYIAYNENGELVKGKLPAANEEIATELLDYAGYQAINLKPFTPFISLDKLWANLYQVKPSEIVLFYRELAMLFESGIDIVAALDLLQDQMSNRVLKKILGEVIADLRRGNPLSAALGKHPHVFSPVYCRLVGVGEQGGSLETILRQIADYMEKSGNISKEIKSALMLPVITSVVTVVVMGILVTFVLPAFGGLYESLGVELPPLVKILITAANTVQTHGIYFLLAIFIAIASIIIYIKTQSGRYQWDKLILRLPLLGRVNHLTELARYCRIISLLFRAGLPLTEIMSLVIQGSNNRVMTRALINVQQDMVKGEGLSQPMAKNPIFLSMMVQMVRVGEETGNLDVTLLAVAQSYETEAEDKTRSLIELIQPTMTLFIGLVVGLIAISVTSAIYSTY